MNAARPRFRVNGRCAGCGQVFADLDAFTLHAAGKLDPAPGAKRRCRSPEEMRALGMWQRRNGEHVWIATKGQPRPPLART